MASIGLAVNVAGTEERAVFTQLKPVRLSGGDGGDDSSVFEEVKPPARIPANPLEMSQVRPGLHLTFCLLPLCSVFGCSWYD